MSVFIRLTNKASEEKHQLSSQQQPPSPTPLQKYGSAYRIPVQPEVFISADDFGVAPELLTTAQKVAILESQSFQTKSFNPILPSDKPTSKRSSATDTYVPGYTLTHLIQFINFMINKSHCKQSMYVSFNSSISLPST